MVRVLLIDDDELVRNSLTIGLSLEGYEVAAAAHGRDGWDMFSAQRPDIVVTDIIMPEQEGIETILAIRKVDAGIPIIAMSGGSSMGNLNFLEVAKSFGASKVLQKPFSPKELIAAIKACLS